MVSPIALCGRCGEHRDDLAPEDVWHWLRVIHAETCVPRPPEPLPEPKQRTPAVHGSHNMYDYYGCRCDICRSAQSAYGRASYRRRKEQRDAVSG